jgi:putative ABC transport system permease protein
MSSMMRGNLRMALSGVRGAKWRSLLTMLGVIVGIVAVVTIVSIGEGVKRQVAGQLNHFGKELITIRPGHAAEENSVTTISSTDVLFGMGTSTGLSVHDVGQVEQVPDVSLVAPLGVVPGAIQVDDQTFNNRLVIATNRYLPEALNHTVPYGEFWNEEAETANTVVLGYKAASELFGEQVPLGRSLNFHGQSFIVRGVLARFNSSPLSPTANFDKAIFMPYQTAAELTHNNAGLYVLLAKADAPSDVPDVMGGIKARLQHAHGGQQDFTVMSPEQNIAGSSDVVRALTVWITAIAALSLFIGGVGIMNIMLLSVTERMHEIGLRKAIGATRRQILGQFVLEATVLSVVGGLIGIILSLAVVGLLHTYTDLKPVMPWQAVGIATGVSLVIGVVFGVVPALKAASKDPIEALRHE